MKTPVAIAILSGAAIALAAGAARAQTAFERCAVIDADAERLACYDAAAGKPRTGAIPLTVTPPVTATPRPAPEPPPAARPSILGETWLLDRSTEEPTVAFHRSNYLLFARRTNSVNNEPYSPRLRSTQAADGIVDATEAKFQVSFKARLFASDERRFSLWAAYTQQSHWQVYNSAISRPFRETNYMPEIIGSFRTDLEAGGFRWRMVNVGLVHQSNGRAEPLSRSWNRVYAEFGIERGNFALLVRPWVRLSESSGSDDNADIEKYLGHGDITALYRWGRHSFSAMVRGNTSTGKGAAQLAWYSPPLFGPLRGYVQVFSGYGESLIDYNWKQTTVGAGVALSDRP